MTLYTLQAGRTQDVSVMNTEELTLDAKCSAHCSNAARYLMAMITTTTRVMTFVGLA